MTEEPRTNPDEGQPRPGEGAEPAVATERHVGAMEIAAAVFILIVLMAGIVYSWNLGFQTGQEAALREAEENSSVPEQFRGVVPRLGVRLNQGQTMRILLEGPGEDQVQEQVLEAGAGDRVVVAVTPQAPREEDDGEE